MPWPYYNSLLCSQTISLFLATSGTSAHSERVCRGGGHVLLQQAGEWGAHKLGLVTTGTPWYIRPCGVCPKPNLSVSFCLLWLSGGGRWWSHVQDGICGEHGPCHGCWKGKSSGASVDSVGCLLCSDTQFILISCGLVPHRQKRKNFLAMLIFKMLPLYLLAPISGFTVMSSCGCMCSVFWQSMFLICIRMEFSRFLQ